MPEVVEDENIAEITDATVDDKVNTGVSETVDKLKENNSTQVNVEKNGCHEPVNQSIKGKAEGNGIEHPEVVSGEREESRAGGVDPSEEVKSSTESSQTSDAEVACDKDPAAAVTTADSTENIKDSDEAVESTPDVELKEAISTSDDKSEISSENKVDSSEDSRVNNCDENMVDSSASLNQDSKEKPREETVKNEDVDSKGIIDTTDDHKKDVTEKKEGTTSVKVDDSDQTEVGSSEDGVQESKAESPADDDVSQSESKDSNVSGSNDDCSKIPEEIDSMITEGRACIAKNNYNGAADLLGQACEKLRELFGELDSRCAPCFYYYGLAMLECAKTENSVLGEGVNKEESESEDEQIPVVKEKESDDGEEGKTEASEDEVSRVNGEAEEEVDAKDEAMETDEAAGDKNDPEANDETCTDVTIGKEEEEEDTTLKAAWEALELAKFIFERQNDDKMLADTLMKLGEVAVESGHKTGIDDMNKSLKLRTKHYGDNHRAIPETHFNIGLSYSLFEMFDEAIEQFETSKRLLAKRIDMLETMDTTDSKNEVKEIKELLPDIDDKIKDMKESKEEKAKADLTLKKKEEGGSSSGMTATDKTVTNLNHLVKRKRKIEEVAETLPEKEAKQACVEKESS